MQDSELLHQRQAARASGLDAWELRRAEKRGAVQARVRLPHKSGGSHVLFGPGELQLLKILRALRAAGIRLVDAGAVVRQLQAMPDGDRQHAVLARFPASRRWDLFSSRDDVPTGAAELLRLSELAQ